MSDKTTYTQHHERTPHKIGAELDFASTEAYNLLRTNLGFSVTKKDCGKIVGVTSPCPQEGKSFTSINLAYSLAEAGNKVVLIDGDMRRPSLAKTLELPISPGLSNLLAEDVRDTLHEGVLHQNLTALMAGDTPPNPSKLISSEKMKKVLDSLSHHYDYVIIDLPPVNSVADPLSAAPLLDGMIIVVKHKYTRRSELMETVRRLKFINAPLCGFVYNGYSLDGSGYYKSGYKYYNKYYSHYYSKNYYSRSNSKS